VRRERDRESKRRKREKEKIKSKENLKKTNISPLFLLALPRFLSAPPHG
jgi:hypothetical protein